MTQTYIACDLKSFYASVECVERGLDPLTTNLVVADASRTEKTICLAVSPSLKAYGIPGRARPRLGAVGLGPPLCPSVPPGPDLTGPAFRSRSPEGRSWGSGGWVSEREHWPQAGGG